jgi:hypothetical protein
MQLVDFPRVAVASRDDLQKKEPTNNNVIYK